MSDSISNSEIFRRHIKKTLILIGVSAGGILGVLWSLYMLMELDTFVDQGTGVEWRILLGLVASGAFAVGGIGGLVNVYRFRKLDF